MVFQKVASRATTWSREGLLATYSGAQTVNRVKVEIDSLSGGSAYRVQCQAYIVRDPGALLEDEVRLTNLRGAPYQSLLNKVKKQLK
jgi:ABC-type sugar transport system ATPase subunit